MSASTEIRGVSVNGQIHKIMATIAITLYRSVGQRHVFGRLSMRSRLDLDVVINGSNRFIFAGIIVSGLPMYIYRH